MADENVLDGIVRELNVKIQLFPDEQKRQFKIFNELKKFIDKEVEFWRTLRIQEMRNIFEEFRRIQVSLQNALQTPDQQEAQQIVRRAVVRASRSQFPLLYSETSIGKFLRDLYARHPHSASAAYRYLALKDVSFHLNRDKASFEGLILAFHFSNANAFSAKIAAVESSLEQLATGYQATIDHLEQKGDKLIATMESWQKTFSNEATVSKEAFEKETTNWREGQQRAFDETIQSQNQQFTTFWKESQRKLDELEKTYQEKLRLEGPATYWDTFAENYERRGRKWRNWALGMAGALVLYTIGILAASPSWLLSPEFTAGSIRGTVLIALAVSLLVYVTRLFVKLSTSAHHLSRDARERYQLTHVCLAMIKEGAIQVEDREIILRALFSRADTGLLKTDGGPRMPTGPVGKILGSNR